MDEPSNGELARRLDRIEVLLQGQVLRTEYTTALAHIEHRFGELERDVASEQDARKADVKEVKEQVASTTAQSGTNVRQAIYSGIIPAILFLVGILITISQSRGK